MHRLFDDPMYLARYRRNLSVLKDRYHSLYSYLENIADLNVDHFVHNNRLHIYKGKKCLYETNPDLRLQDIFRNNLRFTSIRRSSREQITNRVLKRNKIFHKYYSRFHDLIEDYTESENSYQVGKKQIPLVFIYGLADGKQIEHLLHTFDIRHVVLLEQNVEMLRASLFIANWSRILDLVQRKNIEIKVILKRDPEQMYREALAAVTQVNAAFIYFALHIFLNQNQNFSKAYESICRETYRLFYLWPVDTEIQNCKATLQNVKEKHKFLRLRVNTKDLPGDRSSAAAVIGAGPSIDEDIEALRENARNMTIFSCGSALMTLYENGIIPDYHIDIERQHNMQQYLAYIDPEYLARIHVLYPVYFRPLPENAYLFRDCTYFLVQNEYHQNLINDAADFMNLSGGLTVTSHALDIVLQMRFDVVFLFGCDLGFVDHQAHHSVHHPHCWKYSPVEYNASFVVKGNFREYVGTNRTFHCELDTYQRLLKTKNNVIVFNLSDGVQIEHTHPLPSRYLNAINFNKLEIHGNRKICKNNDLYSAQNMRYMYKAAVQDLENMLSQPMTDFGRFIDLYMDLQSYMKNKLAKYQPMLFKILQNSILQYMSIVFSNAYVIGDEQKTLEFAKHANRVLCDFLHDLEPEIERLQEEALSRETTPNADP